MAQNIQNMPRMCFLVTKNEISPMKQYKIWPFMPPTGFEILEMRNAGNLDLQYQLECAVLYDNIT